MNRDEERSNDGYNTLEYKYQKALLVSGEKQLKVLI